MSRKCELTGKRPMKLTKVSHSNRKSLTRSLPNVSKRKVWIPSLNRFETMKISARALRTITKNGADAVVYLRDKVKHGQG